jgi:hypothetical protein
VYTAELAIDITVIHLDVDILDRFHIEKVSKPMLPAKQEKTPENSIKVSLFEAVAPTSSDRSTGPKFSLTMTNHPMSSVFFFGSTRN